MTDRHAICERMVLCVLGDSALTLAQIAQVLDTMFARETVRSAIRALEQDGSLVRIRASPNRWRRA